MKIATIIGARPQFIKAAAVSRTINDYNRSTPQALHLTEFIIHTGQHYDEGMSAIFFRELEMPEPEYNLGVGSGSHGKQTGKMIAGIEEILLKESPDLVMLYGDTNSTLAGAIAAAKLYIPIAHVEAGLRSYNRRMPEEINRIVADQLSHLLFCPSQVAIDNLKAEGIPPQVRGHSMIELSPGVYNVGDVMADALQFASAKASTGSDVLNRLSLSPKSYFLATVHRAENTEDGQRINNILSAFDALDKTVIFPVHPRTQKLLKEIAYQPPNNVKLIEPVGYFDAVALEKAASMILTDSGGMQKEAYWLNVPCVTLRDETEWVETVENGWNVLSGADSDRIIAAVRDFKMPAINPPLYGDGHAAEKIIQIISENYRPSLKTDKSIYKRSIL